MTVQVKICTQQNNIIKMSQNDDGSEESGQHFQYKNIGS